MNKVRKVETKKAKTLIVGKFKQKTFKVNDVHSLQIFILYKTRITSIKRGSNTTLKSKKQFL